MASITGSAAALGVVAMLLAGCGGTDKSPSSSAKRAAGAAPASPDARHAQAALVKQTDLPAGWAQLKGSAADTLNSQCPEVSTARRLATARASEPNFAKPPNAVVQSLVFVYRNVAAAEASLHRFGSQSLRDCVAKELQTRAGTVKGVKVGALSAERLAVPAVADKSTGFAVRLEVSSGATQSVVNEQVAFVRSGRAVAIVAFAQQSASVEAGLRDALVRASGERLAKAFPSA